RIQVKTAIVESHRIRKERNMARIIYDNDQQPFYGNNLNSGRGYRPGFDRGSAAILIIIAIILLFGTDRLWRAVNLNSMTIPPAQGLMSRPAPEIRYVSAGNLNLREEPGNSARASHLLPRGTPVTLLSESRQDSDGDIWLRVSVDSADGPLTGWVDQTWLRRTPNYASRPAVQTSVASPRNNLRYVAVDNLYLRDEPDQNARISFILPRGVPVTLVGESRQDFAGDVWLSVSIETSQGPQFGWVSEKYLE
ncbi:MAG: SH3 domain-containing protein, partial [Blastocatellia bacterium]